ncbi:hypothetical protein HMPREF3227_00666 [Corynebacterium sp. CMW7794]|uniref:Uncharacterized protein n=1 Tax=Corynebacterium phoceense TaxID=1686286 RepID=A0A540R5F8_9CORY|nr:hypothetical protein HMPREF3227_00666 [Corynebacterium sp. CMW7794]TQE42973.1 hypothetical protein EJK80_09495 [Corynebacterium phoceense]
MSWRTSRPPASSRAQRSASAKPPAATAVPGPATAQPTFQAARFPSSCTFTARLRWGDKDNLWFHGGNLHQSRHYSRYLALQLKARYEGLDTPVYKLAEVHHLR